MPGHFKTIGPARLVELRCATESLGKIQIIPRPWRFTLSLSYFCSVTQAAPRTLARSRLTSARSKIILILSRLNRGGFIARAVKSAAGPLVSLTAGKIRVIEVWNAWLVFTRELARSRGARTILRERVWNLAKQ